MKELFLNGPIQVSMHLYDDLRWHETGELKQLFKNKEVNCIFQQ